MADVVPLAALFGKAEAASVQISPAGKYIAWLARSDGVLNLWLAALPLPKGDARANARQLTKAAGRDICFCFRFTRDEKRIVYLREPEHGSELYHLFTIDLMAGTGEGRDLLAAHSGMTCAVGFVGGLQLWLPATEPNMAIIATGRGSLLWDLSSLNLEDGTLTRLESNPASTKVGIARLVLTLILHVIVHGAAALLAYVSLGIATLPAVWLNRLAPAPSATVQYFVRARDGLLVGRAEAAISMSGVALRMSKRTKSGAWEAACPDVPFSELNMQLVGSGAASGTMRLDALGPDDDPTATVGLHACDVSDTTAYVEYPGGKVLANDARADICSFVSNPVSGGLEAIVVTAARSELVPCGDAGARLCGEVERVREALRGADGSFEVHLTSRTLADDAWIVTTTSDTAAATYYLHTPYAHASPAMLLSARPQLKQLSLATTEAICVPARDGESIPGYLTRPRGAVDGGVAVPMALVLHGGPNARDTAGFDALTQLLAARGIAVLSLNYRGSTGYGRRFYRLGMGNVRGMHEDVEDARRWAVESGLAVENRVAIVGGSWGGYLALGGATGIGGGDEKKNGAPLYAAVVAIVPLVAVGCANTSPAFRGDPLVKQYWYNVYGKSVSTEQAAARALSPLHRLDSLHKDTKILLVHGEKDPRVPREHGDQVAAGAQQRGLAGAHLTYAREGHSIRREPNVLHLWHVAEVFLCRALGLQQPPDIKGELTEGNSCTVHWDSMGLV